MNGSEKITCTLPYTTMTLRLVICAILAVAVYGTADCQSLANITYDISVTLDDESHTLNGALRLNLTNETGDELRKLMFHLYPNAYSGTGTAFAKQHLALRYKDFQLSKEEEKGGYFRARVYPRRGEAALSHRSGKSGYRYVAAEGALTTW